MTQEDKQLLLADLCARLPYNVKCNVYKRIGTIIGINDYGSEIDYGNGEDTTCEIKYCKPYLRPLSSMTEEEKEELSHLLPKNWSVEIDQLNNFYFDTSLSIFIEIDVFLDIIDWLNAHHLDYRGLIEKGLAISTEVFNPYE